MTAVKVIKKKADLIIINQLFFFGTAISSQSEDVKNRENEK